MRAFMDKEFLLENEIARTLFHKYAENQPIYDYHNHLPPREIAERKQYENLTQLWLAADHYKWRAVPAAWTSSILPVMRRSTRNSRNGRRSCRSLSAARCTIGRIWNCSGILRYTHR